MGTNNKHLIIRITGVTGAPVGQEQIIVPMKGLITYGSTANGSGLGVIDQHFFYKNGKKLLLLSFTVPPFDRERMNRAIIKLLASDDMSQTFPWGTSAALIDSGWHTI